MRIDANRRYREIEAEVKEEAEDAHQKGTCRGRVEGRFGIRA